MLGYEPKGDMCGIAALLLFTCQLPLYNQHWQSNDQDKPMTAYYQTTQFFTSAL